MANAIGVINDFLYGKILIILLLVGGAYFTIRSGVVQFRLIKEQFHAVSEKPADGKGVSSFQALMVSTASRVGTGNIVGVSTALCLGGYGAIFWMWVVASIGGASAFVETTLAQIFKKKGDSGSFGGPAYYIEKAFKSRPLAMLFTTFLILTFGFGFNMLASYNLQSTFSGYSFYNPSVTPWVIGLVLGIVVCYCLLGGGKRIIRVTTVLVPFMGLAYVLVSLIIVVLNIGILPSVIQTIFANAFDFQAIFGGLSGSCLMFGIKRGLYSNEAGAGSAPNAAASAQVAHPAKQGFVQILSVFLDTLLLCTATAMMCLCSGVAPTEELSGAPYVQASIGNVLGSFGPIFITCAMMLFAFTTLLGNLYYVDVAWNYVFGKKPSEGFMTIYRIVASIIIIIGAGLSAETVWNIADFTMGGMTLINMPTILFLSKYAFRALKDYEKKIKSGGELTFKSTDIDLPYETEYWN